MTTIGPLLALAGLQVLVAHLVMTPACVVLSSCAFALASASVES